jgi:hypothetical protein
MVVACSQGPPTGRAFLLKLDRLRDAISTKDMATNCCGGLLQLVPTYWAGKNWFLGSLLSRLFASLHCTI